MTDLSAWLRLAYGGDVTGSLRPARPDLAAALIAAGPGWGGDLSAACAVGDVEAIGAALAADPGCIDRAAGPLRLPPLVAVTHSRLARHADHRDRIRDAARLLLDSGADPNAAIGNRFPPHSLEAPDPAGPLSALYGAAGVNRDPVLTALLLEAGADPNDGESLYHSLEEPACTRLLLAHGARVAGTNALRRALDMKTSAALRLLLEAGADPNEPPPPGPGVVWGPPLLRAIGLRCPIDVIGALLEAGADVAGRTEGGLSAYSLALQTGRSDTAALLAARGADTALTEADRFVACCAAGDEAEARAIQAARPDLPAGLPAQQRRFLADSVAWGDDAGARPFIALGVALGWPIDAKGGDWDASALNHAVLRGDAGLAAFLLAHGASWQARHGFGDDVLGTLSWASIHEPAGSGDWPGCAAALRRAGMPRGVGVAGNAERVEIAGRVVTVSAAVAAALID